MNFQFSTNVALAYNSRAGGRFNAPCTLLGMKKIKDIWKK